MLAAYGVPAAPTIDARRLNWLPQIAARGWFQRMDHPVTGPIDYLGLPMTFSGMPRPLYWRAAPTLGQDNEEVLARAWACPTPRLPSSPRTASSAPGRSGCDAQPSGRCRARPPASTG